MVAISAWLAKSICCERLPQADVDLSVGLFFVHKEVDPCSLKPLNQLLVLIFDSLGPRGSFSLLINRTNDRVSNARLVPISLRCLNRSGTSELLLVGAKFAAPLIARIVLTLLLCVRQTFSLRHIEIHKEKGDCVASAKKPENAIWLECTVHKGLSDEV